MYIINVNHIKMGNVLTISSTALVKAGDEQFLLFSLSDTDIIKYVVFWGGQEKYEKGEKVELLRNERGQLRTAVIKGLRLVTEPLDFISPEKISDYKGQLFYRDQSKKLWAVKQPHDRKRRGVSYIFLQRAIDDNRFARLPAVLQHRLEMLQKFVPDFKEKYLRRELEGCLQAVRIANYFEQCNGSEIISEKVLRKIVSPNANPLFSFALAEGLRDSLFFGKHARPFNLKLLAEEKVMRHPMAGDWDEKVVKLGEIITAYVADLA